MPLACRFCLYDERLRQASPWYGCCLFASTVLMPMSCIVSLSSIQRGGRHCHAACRTGQETALRLAVPTYATGIGSLEMWKMVVGDAAVSDVVLTGGLPWTGRVDGTCCYEASTSTKTLRASARTMEDVICLNLFDSRLAACAIAFFLFLHAFRRRLRGYPFFCVSVTFCWQTRWFDIWRGKPVWGLSPILCLT